MNLKKVTTEQILYGLILLVAIGIRILRIGDAPLSDFEAGRALEALHISRGENTTLSPGPAYPILTGLTFMLFSDANAYARLWPIIAGCCLVIFPFFLRSMIGRKASLIMALGLAFSPMMVFYSRLAGTEIMVAGFSMMALGLTIERKPIPAGIFAGLAMISGPSALHGLLGAGIAFLVGIVLTRINWLTPLSGILHIRRNTRALSLGIFSALVTILAVGTLFLFVPTGMGSFAEIFPAYLAGWISSFSIPTSSHILSLLLYNPVSTVFGMLGIISAWREKVVIAQWLSLYAGVSFLLAIIYPGQELFSWIWLLLPLWALASIELAKYFRLEGAEYLPAAGQAMLILILMALGWINMAGLNVSGGVQQTDQLRWAIIGGTIVLGGITSLLIGLGWSVNTAKQGLVWGLLLGFGFYGFSVMWGASQLRSGGELELIGVPPAPGAAGDFQTTLGDLSEWRTGMRDTLDVVLTTSSPSLVWEMRNWQNAKFLPSVPIGELPSVIISSEDQPEPNLAIAYRGQDFAWWLDPGWDGAIPDNWPRWLVFREAPQETSKVLVWARVDLFPGGVLEDAETNSWDFDEELPNGSLPVE